MNYQECTYCVMDTSDPEIFFNNAGECNHCITATDRLKKNWIKGQQGKTLLKEAVNKIKTSKRSGSDYDCIVGMSGGIDSSYLLHFISVEMKLNPLVVHIDAGWNSDEAEHNVNTLTDKLGLSLRKVKVEWESMRDLQLAYLQSGLANQDVPQDHVFFAKLYQIAEQNKIKTVITGSNLTSESILPMAWGHDAMDSIQLKAIHKRFGKIKNLNLPIVSFLKLRLYYPYIYKMNVLKPLNWIDYDKNKALKFLEENYGWQYYGGKHYESVWTRFFQAYYLPKKFGFDKRRAHLSSLIVAGQITRDQAKLELKLPLYTEDRLEQDKSFICNKLNISAKELDHYLSIPNKNFLYYPNQAKYHNFFRFLKKLILIK